MPTPPSKTRTAIVALVKTAIGVGLIGLLVYQAQGSDRFAQLVEQPKNWALLGAALVLSVVSTVLGFLRWRLVVLAAGVPLSIAEALRLGALGFALNFVGPGAIGGDAVKAALLARRRVGHRTASVTTIFVDRLLALFAMMVFATVGMAWLELSGDPLPPEVRGVCSLAVAVSVLGPVAFGVLLIPGVVGAWTVRLAERLPVVGHLLAELLATWHEYRSRLGLLAAALAMSFVVDFLVVLAFYCVAQGMPLTAPSLVHHLFIVPFAFTVAAIPISPAGLGTLEMTVDFFYTRSGAEALDGALVAFTHRLTLLAVGAAAVVYYLTQKASLQAELAEE